MSETSPLTFTQGFMLGQISFLAIILLFMRYVVFSPADKGDEQGWKRRREEREKVRLYYPSVIPSHCRSISSQW
jgi:maintenance of morphology protein 1